MFSWQKKKPAQPPPPISLRDMLFGDMPAAQWPPEAAVADAEPWASFVRARRARERGDRGEAERALRAIVAMRRIWNRGTTSRHGTSCGRSA